LSDVIYGQRLRSETFGNWMVGRIMMLAFDRHLYLLLLYCSSVAAALAFTTAATHFPLAFNKRKQ